MHIPPRPGECIEGMVFDPWELSTRQVAECLGDSASTFQVLGRSAESWLAMQDSHDLWQARQRHDRSGLTPMELTPA
jgi:plasmid maintenance system antidote protein VapI